MHHPTRDRSSSSTEPSTSRFRSPSAIALTAAVPASAPALALTGSVVLAVLIAVLT